MAALAEPTELDVYLRGEIVGTLTRPRSGRIAFQYAPEVADRHPGAPLLSASLPVQAERYPNAAAKPFFEGLLPEDVIRRSVADEFRVSYGNTFGLLARIGAECAGAAVIVPHGEDPPDPGEAEVAWLDEDELAEKIGEVRRRPLGIEPGRVRLSLGGVQDKLVLVRAPNGRFGSPLHGAPSTHIVKPNQERYADIVANEAFCLRVAACTGLTTARSEVVPLGGVDCLIVERFDRTIGPGSRVERLHQEDFCQALGVLPEAKYESEGGPSAAAVADAIRRLSDQPAADVIAFVRALIVSYFVGNSDAHAKNYALLYEPIAQARLAPLYDIVSTAVYDVEQTLAMTIGGVHDPEAVTERAWEELARACGLSARQVLVELRRLAALVRRCAAIVREQAVVEGWHRDVVDLVRDVCERRAARFAVVNAP